MTYLRNQERMVYQSVLDYMKAQLTTLGWFNTDTDTLPFGATISLTWIEEALDPKLAEIQANTIAFSEGDLPDDEEGELGAALGGLWSVNHTFFIDVYGESRGVAKAIASDVRAILTGRLDGTSCYQDLLDYSSVPAAVAPGHLLHFEDVEITRPMTAPSKLRWEVIKATCVHEFNASQG